jgi:nucleoside-diphosphate-sugar epimerase
LTHEDDVAKTAGVYREKEYNDWEGVHEATSLPDYALHRNVDKIVLDAGINHGGADKGIYTAIVCPPTIYGPGRGSGNKKSMQAYLFAATVLKRGKGFVVGDGKNVWHEVHVQDLSDVYLALGEAAVNGGSPATWGKEGYYFAENGSFVWGDLERAIDKAAFEKGFLKTDEVDHLSIEETNKLHPVGSYAWGTNSRGHAIRARKLFGWSPHRPKLLDLVPDIVDLQAQNLGIAQKA